MTECCKATERKFSKKEKVIIRLRDLRYKVICFYKDRFYKTIAEEENPQKEWYAEASKMTLRKLPRFIRKMKRYNHDYGTACTATGALAVASAHAYGNYEGITGFQASCIMWEFVRQWSYSHNKCGLKIFNYDDMLYPQYDERFEKTISQNTFDNLQKQAISIVADKGRILSDDVRQHLLNIIHKEVPFGYKIKDN